MMSDKLSEENKEMGPGYICVVHMMTENALKDIHMQQVTVPAKFVLNVQAPKVDLTTVVSSKTRL